MAGLVASGVVRHELKFRLVTVKKITKVTENMLRFTLTSPELHDFVETEPADHVKIFFPDPRTGQLSWPELPGTSGQGDGEVIKRDYTPLEFRAGDEPELDIEIYVHGTEGVASDWAAAAKEGDQLGIIGPRGSRPNPEGISHLVVVADESALPATRMWLRSMKGVKATALIFAAEESTTGYFQEPADAAHSIHWFVGENADAQALESLKQVAVDETTYFFLAGEATALIPMRRYLRRELELPTSQVRVSGYWKIGVSNRDHHDPVDPNDVD